MHIIGHRFMEKLFWTMSLVDLWQGDFMICFAISQITILRYHCVWQSSINVFSAKCDLRDSLSYIGDLRHFTLSDIWGMRCDEFLLVRDFASWFPNLRIFLVGKHPLPFCDAMLFIERVILFELIIKLKSFYIFWVFC